MHISTTGLDLIKRSESCKLTAYKCPAGVWTIGYGHTGDEVYGGLTITQDEANTLLRLDVAQFEVCVGRTCLKATQSQFDAMVSLAFNIGGGNFQRSSVARLHNAGRYPEAQQAFALWNKAGGKVLNGLVTRRAREADRYDDDDLPTDVEDMPQRVDGEAPLSASRGIKGGAGAGIATVGAIAADQAQKIDFTTADPSWLMEGLHTALPYLQQYGWVIGGVALGFIGWQLWARYQDRSQGRC